jgi:Tol biopolymer transport system component
MISYINNRLDLSLALSEDVNAAMNFPSLATILTACLSACLMVACASRQNSVRSATPAILPTQSLRPYVAYLNEGDLWVVRSDGSDRRVLAAAPEGETIQDFVWTPDGRSIYFSIGLQLFEVVLQTGNVASAGELAAQPGITVDRLEMGRDGQRVIVHALDADAAARLFAVAIGQRDSRELTVDGYTAIAQPRCPVIRSAGEMSVSPDGRRVLFKDMFGTGEELFVADVETGARIRITNLYELAGFEESVETEGGRRVIEATWSPDGRYVVFNPMQSCSETGLCYGRLFLVDAWGGAQLQLSIEMMVSVPLEWTHDGRLLVYDDGSSVVVADTNGNPKALANGHHPKWQPMQAILNLS